MKYLFIDSATANLVVAIIIDEKIKYFFNEHTANDTSSVIMKVIADAFKTANITPQELDKIFVSTGPGSFTGIRVGLTVAKTMAFALNLPVIPISSLEIIASSTPDNSNIALIDARRGYVYAGIYDKNLNNISPDKHIKLVDITVSGTYISYDNIEGAIKPNVDILKVIKKHENSSRVNPHTLNPRYLKLTEAEERLQKND